MIGHSEKITVGLGERFREIRHGLGLTQTELAEKLLTTQKVVTHIELGRSEPRLSTIGKLCGLAKITPAQFFEGLSSSDIRYARMWRRGR